MSLLYSTCGRFRMRPYPSAPGTSVSRVPRSCPADSRRVRRSSPFPHHALLERRFPSRKGGRERGR